MVLDTVQPIFCMNGARGEGIILVCCVFGVFCGMKGSVSVLITSSFQQYCKKSMSGQTQRQSSWTNRYNGF